MREDQQSVRSLLLSTRNSRNPQGGHVGFKCRNCRDHSGIRGNEKKNLIVGVRSAIVKFIPSKCGQLLVHMGITLVQEGH